MGRTAKVKISKTWGFSARFMDAMKLLDKQRLPFAEPRIDWGKKTMTMAQMEAYEFLVFEHPKPFMAKDDNGNSAKGIYVTVKKNNRRLGYVPLQPEYEQAWVDLCYMVVYCKEVARIANNITGVSKAVQGYLRMVRDASLTRLRYYIYVRRLIMEEIDDNWSQPHDLKTFKEFMVKERFDYQFLSEMEFSRAEHRDVDPVDERTMVLMGIFTLSSTT
jgi:hypothetical protein